MPLDQAARAAFKALEKELKTTFREKAKTDSLIIRNGRKVISVRKWKKLAETASSFEILRYLPSEFMYFYSAFKETKDQRILDEREKWIKDYEELLISKQDPGFGNLICKKCLLYPMFDAGSVNILNMLAKGIELSSPDVPCRVVNYFECPNQKLANDPKIFDYGGYGKIVYKRLQFAHQRSNDDNQKTFEIDYENGTVFRYNHRFGYFREDLISQDVRELRLHRTSNVPILNEEDIKQCLADEDLLQMLLEQYEDAENSGYLPEWTVKNETDEIKIARESKNDIIKFFTSIKDKIESKDMSALSNEILDKKQRIQDESIRQSQRTKFPDEMQRCEQVERSGICSDCNRFANIKCLKCNIWHCFMHWESHAKNIHVVEF